MKNSLKIGITGGIGSGKSTVCKVIETMGFPVYYSDKRARFLTEEHPETVAAIVKAFGDEAYKSGVFDRERMASIVFSDPEKRELLNSIVHPAVKSDFFDWCERQESEIVFQESALLFETGNYRHFDKSVLVVSPMALRIERLMARDGSTEEQIRARIANQLSDDEKLRLADFVIHNNEDELIIPQLERIIAEIRS